MQLAPSALGCSRAIKAGEVDVTPVILLAAIAQIHPFAAKNRPRKPRIHPIRDASGAGLATWQLYFFCFAMILSAILS